MDRAKDRFARLRRRFPLLDHLVRMVAHYGRVEGSVLAGAVTYFGFLSFFPLLALGFAVVGYLSVYYPDARDSLAIAIEQIFPGIVSRSGRPGTIRLQDIENAKAAAGIVGFLGLLYSGLGWLSGLRTALQDTFEVPRSRSYNFVVGKLVDLLVLGILGTVMVVSVGLSGAVKGLTGAILDLVRLAGSPLGPPLIWAVGTALALAASTLLFYVMYWLLGDSNLPKRVLVRGALLAAIGFEALKLIVVNVLGGVGGTAFAPLAIAITLVVWINYASRLVLYGASWAATAADARTTVDRRTDRSEADTVAAAAAELDARVPLTPASAAAPSLGFAARFDAGSAVVGALAAGALAVLLRRRDPDA